MDVARGTQHLHRHPQGHAPPSYPLPEGYDTPEEDTTPRRDLHEMIARLDEPDRTIVTLHLEGYDYKEIGQRLGMSKNNIGVRLMRAKERLRKEWER